MHELIISVPEALLEIPKGAIGKFLGELLILNIALRHYLNY